MVCRRGHVVDLSGSTDVEMEAAVLHAAWAIKSLGSVDGAVHYLDYLADIPPAGLKLWVLPLLAGQLLLTEGDAYGAMGHFETAQEHHCREDILMRRFQPMDWYLQLSPWASAADQLFAAGFPEVAADAYRETLKRAAACTESVRRDG